MDSLKDLRKKLDVLDKELVALILERYEISARIGETKREIGMDYYDPAREREILEKIAGMVDDDLVEVFERIFTAIFDGSKHIQVTRKGEGK